MDVGFPQEPCKEKPIRHRWAQAAPVGLMDPTEGVLLPPLPLSRRRRRRPPQPAGEPQHEQLTPSGECQAAATGS